MIDLHLHSTYSDGTMTPAELVKQGADIGLSALSITDHDTVSATEEALAEGKKYAVEVVPGLEISVKHREMDLHLLGYYFDWRDRGLLETLETLQGARDDRNRKIIKKLQAMGIALSDEQLQEEAGTGVAGRPHVARLLVKNNIVKNNQQAFSLYLKAGRCAYVPRFLLGSSQAIRILHDAGGYAVLAHPGQISCSMNELSGIINELKRQGIDGLETYYPTQRGDSFRKIRALAGKYELLETGGSDYHGDTRPNTSMAGTTNKFVVPDTVIKKLHEKKNG